MRNGLVYLGLLLVACSSGERDDASTIFGSSFTFGSTGSELSTEDDSASGGNEDPTTASEESGSTDDTATTDPDTTDTNTTDTNTTDPDTTDTNTTDPDTDDTADPACGNGLIDPGEECDGGNLNGQSCVDQGFDGGVLACDPTICVFDTSGCMDMPSNECDQYCNGCTCPSFECTMCCALQDKVDACGGGMCSCF